MPTECSADLFGFARVEGRAVVAAFDGGAITSDAGALLLGATDRAIGVVERFAGCFRDNRAPELIEHTLPTLVGQRVFALALGYEDLLDHDELRHDPTLAMLAGKLSARRQDCAPLAGKSTLNRLEHGGAVPTRYHRIAWDEAVIERLFVDVFLEAHRRPPKQIILDLDATDDPLHGHQEGRFFHGYYDCYCYLPLYIFCGRHLLAAKLRPANIDGSAGALEEVARIVAQIRQRWPAVRILLRADSGFAGPFDRLRRADDLVRGERRGLSVWPGAQPAAGRRDRRRTRRGRSTEPTDRHAGTPLQGLYLAHAGELEPRTPGRRQGGPSTSSGGPRVKPIPALSSPR